MRTIKLCKLKEQYHEVCNNYAAKFCNKQGLPFDGWVSNDVGGIAMCGDYFFNLHDIITDVNDRCPKGLILQWQDESVAHPNHSINYWSYTKGLRFNHIKK